jgi:hypothetical protein
VVVPLSDGVYRSPTANRVRPRMPRSRWRPLTTALPSTSKVRLPLPAPTVSRSSIVCQVRDVPDPVEYSVRRDEDGAVLEVVMVPLCFSCAQARNLTAEVAAPYPALDVRVVDLGQPGVRVPRGIVAVPVSVLDGHVLFTGHPTPEALTVALSLLRAGTNDDHGEGRRATRPCSTWSGPGAW